MAGRQTRSRMLQKKLPIVNDVKDDSDVSSFEGKGGHDATHKFFSLN